jgi:hypothetical protein
MAFAPETDQKQDFPPAALTALKGSGFPFQTAVAQVIRSTGCSIHASEYAWRGLDGESSFLDIVAISKPFVLTIECKKTRHEIFTFLLPLGGDRSTGDVDEFRGLRVAQYNDVAGRMQVYCENWNVWPRSPSCEFCIVGSATSGTQRMLEKDAALLIGATDAFARDLNEFRSVTRTLPAATFTNKCAYPVIPILVTNAKMYTARYHPREVSLETGEFPDWPSEMEDDVPWIRFHKTFLAGTGT